MECGHKNPGDVEFCTKCRAKMVLECADCGFKSPQGSEFCGSCGNETEFRIKERQSTERKEAEERQSRFLKEAEERQSRARREAKAAAKREAAELSEKRARWQALARTKSKVRADEVRKTLRRTRIVVVGIWLTFYLLPTLLTLLLLLAYIGFTGRFLKDRHPHLRWGQSLAAPVGFAVTNCLIVFFVLFLTAVAFEGLFNIPDVSYEATGLAEILGLWYGGPEGVGFNYPLFRDFIIPWDWPFSPIGQFN